MKVSLQHQQGLTFISLIFVLGLIGFFILLVLKIGPIYLDHSKVANALSALEKSTDIAARSVPEVRQSLDKRFNISYVTAVTQEDVKITKSDNYLKVEIEYEVVKKIIGNLSVLVEFYDFIEVGQK
jgi:flagellar biogenesis protein FliO